MIMLHIFPTFAYNIIYIEPLFIYYMHTLVIFIPVFIVHLLSYSIQYIIPIYVYLPSKIVWSEQNIYSTHFCCTSMLPSYTCFIYSYNV